MTVHVIHSIMTWLSQKALENKENIICLPGVNLNSPIKLLRIHYSSIINFVIAYKNKKMKLCM